MASKNKRVRLLDPETNLITPLDPLTPPSVPHSPHSPLYSASSPASSSSSTSRTPRTSPPTSIVVYVHRALSLVGGLRFNAAMPLKENSFYPSGLRESSPDSPQNSSRSDNIYDMNFLADAATSPPLRSLFLICDYLPWRIEVVSSLPSLFVTVYDVLHAIYSSLRTPLSPAEWSFFASDQKQFDILQSFEDRLNTIPDSDARDDQRAESVRRIDCLIGRTSLLGIEQISAEKMEGFAISWEYPP